MPNRNKWILTIALVVGLWEVCSGAASINMGMITEYSGGTYENIPNTKNLFGVFVYNGAVVNISGGITHSTDLFIYSNGKLYVQNKIDCIRVVAGTMGAIKVHYDQDLPDPQEDIDYNKIVPNNSPGTLISYDGIKTENLIVGGTLNILGGESDVTTLSGDGKINFYVGKDGVGTMSVTNYTDFTGSIYVGLDGLANIAPMVGKTYDILPAGMKNDKVTISDVFFTGEVSGEFYQIKLNESVLNDNEYTVNSGAIGLNGESGVLKINPAGEHYELRMVVSGVAEGDADKFLEWLEPNGIWKASQMTSETSNSLTYLLSAIFSSAKEHILAWDFSLFNGSNEGSNVTATSISGREVPEPSSLALILIGLAGGYLVWRRNRGGVQVS